MKVSKPKYWQFYKKNEQDKGMLEGQPDCSAGLQSTTLLNSSSKAGMPLSLGLYVLGLNKRYVLLYNDPIPSSTIHKEKW